MAKFHRAKDGDKIPISDYNLKADYLEALANMKVIGGKFLINRSGATLDVSGGPQTKAYWVKLTENLADVTTGNSSTATAVPLFHDTDDRTDGASIAESTIQEITVTNRKEGFSADAEEELLVIRVDVGGRLEWHPVAGTSTGSSAGFPPGTGNCDCDHCLEGITIPDAVEQCCRSHTTWTFINPWLTCEDTELTVNYAGADTWISDEFDGPEGNPNIYRWQLTIDVDGVDSGNPAYTYLTLILAEDNGGDDVCIVYGRLGFDCLCDNSLTRKKPFGKVSGIEISDTSCNVCLKPKPHFCNIAHCQRPGYITVEIPDIFNDSCADGCDLINGVQLLLVDTSTTPTGTGAEEDCVFRLEIPIGTSCSGGVCKAEIVLYPYYFNLVLDVKLSCQCTGSGGDYYAAGKAYSWTIPLQDITGCTEDIDLSYSHSYLFNVPGDGSDCPTPGLETECDLDPTGTTARVILSGTSSIPSNTGACGDDTCDPPVTPTNPAGYCCVGDGCLDFIDESMCADFGGTWHTSGDCGTGVCYTLGACCFTQSNGTAVCTDSSALTCAAIGGTWTGGEVCASFDCTGACCRTDGSCDETTASDCDATGEYFWGPGTTCATVDGCHSCCVSTLGGGSEDCVTDSDCECVYVASQAECFALSGSDDSKAYHAAPCATRYCNCDAGSETCDNNPA